MAATARTDVPALRHLLVAGAVFTAAAAAAGGGRAGISCAAGVALSAVNLWLLARVVGVFTARPGGAASAAWTGVAALKALLLYGAVVVMVTGGLVEMVPLLGGLLALPVGIVSRTLLSRGDSVV